MLRPLLLLVLAATGCEGRSASPSGATTLFLNRGGARLHQGSDDAARNQSSLVRGEVAIPAAELDDATWTGVVDCVRAQFSAFNLRIVDERPSDPNYLMAV